MGYSTDDSCVRVDLFKPSGKWYTTLAVKWVTDTCGLLHVEFARSLKQHCGANFPGYFAVCLEPYHVHAHPISMKLDDVQMYIDRYLHDHG